MLRALFKQKENAVACPMYYSGQGKQCRTDECISNLVGYSVKDQRQLVNIARKFDPDFDSQGLPKIHPTTVLEQCPFTYYHMKQTSYGKKFDSIMPNMAYLRDSELFDTIDLTLRQNSGQRYQMLELAVETLHSMGEIVKRDCDLRPYVELLFTKDEVGTFLGPHVEMYLPVRIAEMELSDVKTYMEREISIGQMRTMSKSVRRVRDLDVFRRAKRKGIIPEKISMSELKYYVESRVDLDMEDRSERDAQIVRDFRKIFPLFQPGNLRVCDD